MIFGLWNMLFSHRHRWELPWAYFDVSPSLNSTSHLIFDSVDSLLQHWTNTRYWNGILRSNSYTWEMIDIFFVTFSRAQYCARNCANWHTPLPWHSQQEVPTEPEWTVMDPELSFLSCWSDPRNSSASGYWHLTLVATHPLNVLYFDGSSTTKMQSGTLDSQDIVIWGEVRPDRTLDKRKRIKSCVIGAGSLSWMGLWGQFTYFMSCTVAADLDLQNGDGFVSCIRSVSISPVKSCFAISQEA